VELDLRMCRDKRLHRFGLRAARLSKDDVDRSARMRRHDVAEELD
jgi:hypothetical protein